jgi:hypothetical protein
VRIEGEREAIRRERKPRLTTFSPAEIHQLSESTILPSRKAQQIQRITFGMAIALLAAGERRLNETRRRDEFTANVLKSATREA